MKTKLNYNGCVTVRLINNASQLMSYEEIKEMNQKMEELISISTFPDCVTRAMAKEFFRLGYVLAHCNNKQGNFIGVDIDLNERVPAVESHD